MGFRGYNIAILLAIVVLWGASSTQHEKRIVGDAESDRLARLEDQAATAPADAARLRVLAQAYLELRQPGMALAAIERSSARQDFEVEHLYARALLDEGRSGDALAAEKRVLDGCARDHESSCSTWLVASATRRAEILEQLVELGVEDANAHPEASNLAYHNATRQVSLSFR